MNKSHIVYETATGLVRIPESGLTESDDFGPNISCSIELNRGFSLDE